MSGPSELQKQHLIVDPAHDILAQHGFSSKIEPRDRDRLRAIVKKVHLAHYPEHLITNYEADKLIDVLAPETVAYLIRKNYAAVK